jgi:RNA polymerase sigma-70 factor (ECF subfamily)
MSLASRLSDNPPSADEAALVRLARAGDAEAFAALVRQHQRMIHALTYRLTGSEADAADLAQETFVRAWRLLGGFRGECSVATWLYRIAVNAGLNWKAGTERRRRAHEDWAAERESFAGEAPAGSHSDQVNEALQRLEPDYRAAVVLTVYEGMNHAEAATVLGCAETTVSWRVWRARQQLRKWLADLAPRKGTDR